MAYRSFAVVQSSLSIVVIFVNCLLYNGKLTRIYRYLDTVCKCAIYFDCNSQLKRDPIFVPKFPPALQFILTNPKQTISVVNAKHLFIMFIVLRIYGLVAEIEIYYYLLSYSCVYFCVHVIWTSFLCIVAELRSCFLFD